MKRTIAGAVALVAVSLAGVGCENSYSKAIKYALRSDPLVLNKDLGDEQAAPDRPGQLPVLSSKDLNEPHNPLYPKRGELFKLKRLLDPALIIRKSERQELERVLVMLFGTPSNPHIQAAPDIIEALKLHQEDDRGNGLIRGSALYREHCLHCHGVTGDGRGPTARWVNPHPRDYRQGLFKFMSVDQTTGEKPPRRDDLYRVVHQGVEGTAMPSFALLPAAHLEDLVSYVIHLSIRGRVEFDTITNAFAYDEQKNTLSLDTERDPLETQMTESLNRIAGDWRDSQRDDRAIKVADYPFATYQHTEQKIYKLGKPLDLKAGVPVVLAGQALGMFYGRSAEAGPVLVKKLDAKGEVGEAIEKASVVMTVEERDSIRRGYQLFTGGPRPGWPEVSAEEAKSANCVSCHKDFGRQANFKFDYWGTLTKPRDLTQGVFRGGRRPVDIYQRIHSGISGSGMIHFGKVITKSENIWSLVNFVKTLPYPAMRKSVGIMID